MWDRNFIIPPKLLKRMFSAAQNYSNAAAMAKEAGLLDECVELYQKAHEIYRQETNPDKAADCLVKAAK